MQPLLSREAMRAADQYAIHTLGLPEMLLMEHAALALVACLKRRFSQTLPNTQGIILAGTGNNGGDVVAAARLLVEAGVCDFKVVLVGEANRRSASLTQQLDRLHALGIRTQPWNKTWLASPSPAWILDGLYGTGLTREVDGPGKEAIEAVQSCFGKSWIVSADLPSGLCANTGHPLGLAVKASETVTFGFYKKGLCTGSAADYVGALSLAAIQIPREVPSAATDFLVEADDIHFPYRAPTSHKGHYGHVYVFAGTPNTEGASALAAWAALRSGSGLVSLVGSEDTLASVRPRLPVELMTEILHPSVFEKPEAVGVIGPGFGNSEAHWGLLQLALASNWKLVLDADALTLISEHKKEAIALLKSRKSPTVFTPHPKEAARLLGKEVAEVEADRYATCRDLVHNFGGAFNLKGKGTLISVDGKTIYAVGSGDTGLSKAGSGDVLSGMMGSFLGQCQHVQEAVVLACFLHGKASEWITQKNGTARCHVASDLNEALPQVFREFE